MRKLSIAVLTVGLTASASAMAQVSSPGRVYYNSSPGTGAPPPPAIPAPQARVYANPPQFNQPPMMTPPNAQRYHGQRANGGRWGGNINGRWWGGMQAPGGWGAYRRPTRGFVLPGYWLAADFLISDFADFGLRAPGDGYSWVRYYDDAVLIDARGRVRDSVSGIAWADADAYAYADEGYASADSAAYAGAGEVYRQPIAPVDPNPYYTRPREYAPPVHPAPPPAIRFHDVPDAGVYYGAGVTYGGTYYVPGATVTTVVVQPATTVVTTTVQEVVTHVVHRRVVHHVYRPKPRCGCR